MSVGVVEVARKVDSASVATYAKGVAGFGDALTIGVGCTGPSRAVPFGNLAARTRQRGKHVGVVEQTAEVNVVAVRYREHMGAGIPGQVLAVGPGRRC